MRHQHNKHEVSMYGQAIIRFRESQDPVDNSNEDNGLHPLLIGQADLDPMPVVELKGFEGQTKRQILEQFGE